MKINFIHGFLAVLSQSFSPDLYLLHAIVLNYLNARYRGLLHLQLYRLSPNL